MRVDTRESKAAPKRDAKARYRHFVKMAIEHKLVWGLFRDGWALSVEARGSAREQDRDAQGKTSFPLWSERQEAERCAKGPWQGYEAAEIPLDDLLEQLLPQLARDGVQPSLSPMSGEPELSPSIAQLILDLEHELDPEPVAEDL
jgi:hypothetical protein